MFRFIPLILGAIFLWHQTANAVSVRTLAFGLPEEKIVLKIRPAEEDPESKTKAKAVEIEVRVNQFGEPTAMSPGTYAAESTDFKLPARFVLPENNSDSYLLLVLPNSDGGCVILPVADDPAHFKKGDRFVMNATTEDLAVRIHTQKFLLKPGRSAYYKLPPPPVPENRIEVEMLHQVDGHWLAFNSTYWPLSPNLRSVVMIYPDPNTSRPRVTSLADRSREPAAGVP
jgi:hypothetical protein